MAFAALHRPGLLPPGGPIHAAGSHDEELTLLAVPPPGDRELIVSTGWVEGPLEEETRARPAALWGLVRLKRIELRAIISAQLMAINWGGSRTWRPAFCPCGPALQMRWSACIVAPNGLLLRDVRRRLSSATLVSASGRSSQGSPLSFPVTVHRPLTPFHIPRDGVFVPGRNRT